MLKYKAITDDNRIPLHTLLPLSQPLALSIIINDTCNFACKFCYRSVKKDQIKKNMTIELFKKIIDDLSGFEESVKTLTIGDLAEPLLHPQFSELIKIAKDCKMAEKVKMSTNASLLNKKISDSIISSGIDIVQISINGISDEHYKEIVNRNIDFNKILENVSYLHSIKKNTQLHIKCIGDFFSEKQKEDFIKIFTPLADTIHIDNAVNQWLDFSVEKKTNSNRFDLEDLNSSSICSRPFYMMMVHCDGKVVPCCVNDRLTFTIGDANNKSLKDIWNGETLFNLRKSFLLGDYKEKFEDCSKCNFFEFQSSEDLTPYRDDLIKKYTKI